MNDYTDIYEKAQSLMKSALSKYANGDFDGGNKDRKEANEYFDLAEKTVNSEMYKNSMIYGENKNFGIIFKVIEENLNTLLKNKNKGKALKQFYSLIKENKYIKEQYKIYNALTSNKNIDNVEKYVNEALSLTKKFNIKDIKENNQKLISIIQKNKLNEMVLLEDNDMNLFNSIEYAITNNKNLSNLNDYINHENIIKENITNRLKNKSQIDIIDNKISEMAEKYSSLLNEEEIKLLYKLKNTKDKENLFNECKKELLKNINGELKNCDESERESWNNIYNTINESKYNKDTFINDVCKMMEIKDTINE